MAKITIDLKNMAEFKRELAYFSERTQNKVMASATAGALRTAIKDIKAAAPRGDVPSNMSAKYGALHKNIKLKSYRSKGQKMRGAKITTADGFWGYFLEKGTKHIPARPWFDPAFEAAKAKVLAELQKRFYAGIKKEWNKA